LKLKQQYVVVNLRMTEVGKCKIKFLDTHILLGYYCNDKDYCYFYTALVIIIIRFPFYLYYMTKSHIKVSYTESSKLLQLLLSDTNKLSYLVFLSEIFF